MKSNPWIRVLATASALALALAGGMAQAADPLPSWNEGESRNVCNVHWHSDVIQGRVIGSGIVARLHAEPAFRAEVEAARVEVAALRAKGARPSRDCAAEAAALAR